MNVSDSPQSPSPDEQPAPPEIPQTPLLELREPLPAVIETTRGLEAVVERFGSGTGSFAIDAERASGYRYSHRAYLIQMRRFGAGTALIDPVPFPVWWRVADARHDSQPLTPQKSLPAVSEKVGAPGDGTRPGPVCFVLPRWRWPRLPTLFALS